MQEIENKSHTDTISVNPYIYPLLGKNHVKTDKNKQDEIFNICCNVFGLTTEQVMQRKRNRELSECRYIYFYFAKKYTFLTFLEIGNYVGLDHSTVIYGERKIHDLISIDKNIKYIVEKIELMLGYDRRL